DSVVAFGVELAAPGDVKARADAGLARVGGGADVAVVARDVVGLRRIRAGAGRGSACPGEVAAVERPAGDRVGPRAHAERAAIDARARVAVVARRAVRLRRVRWTQLIDAGAELRDVAFV